MSAMVSLVGAGPGDPELLTVRAAKRLADADLVLYDALAPAELLELAPRAKRFFVGKRAGRHSITQASIERLMIRAARRGLSVVRLKCGDPFVLGRGGEEALALAAAGVPFEVVPGVSSAIAAPALAGIPVTHRGLATGFVVISGHAEPVFGPIVDALSPNSLTLVVLMGLATRAQLAARLVARGWPATTPTAIALGASQPGGERWLGTLGELANVTIESDHAGVIVVGDVVALAAQIAPEVGEFGEFHEHKRSS
ncbi:MAG TPA: uroporphyrinogen-III C-methyltransferase [Kofleriaceae bacterium]|jgi:uroporphyrin-III C-methyltransferase/precorrin-2 dehydrogenase/sirohydrochlorin ferrochelatase